MAESRVDRRARSGCRWRRTTRGPGLNTDSSAILRVVNAAAASDESVFYGLRMSAPHLTPEEFREQGHRVVDWIADYWASVDDLPVLAQVQPGEVAAALPTSAPEQPETLDAVLADLDAHLVRGLTHWQHPRFFAYFPANSSPAGVLGDLLSSGIGTQGMLWATSPAATELEQVVLDWLRQALALPDALRPGRQGRRRHPGHRLHGDVHGGARRTAPRDRRGRPARRRTGGGVRDLRLHAGPLVAAQGGHDERPRRARRPLGRRRPEDPVDGRRRAARGDGGRRRRGRAAGAGAGGRRYDVHGRDRPDGGDRGGRGRARCVAARRRGLGGRRGGVPRAPLDPRRRRARRLLRDQPAQVAAHDLRLQRLLGARPDRPGRGAVDPAGVPAQPRVRVRRRGRLPRLAPPARPPVPCAEAVDRAAHLRALGTAGPHRGRRRPGHAVRRPGARRRPLRDRHRAGAGAGGLPRRRRTSGTSARWR